MRVTSYSSLPVKFLTAVFVRSPNCVHERWHQQGGGAVTQRAGQAPIQERRCGADGTSHRHRRLVIIFAGEIGHELLRQVAELILLAEVARHPLGPPLVELARHVAKGVILAAACCGMGRERVISRSWANRRFETARHGIPRKLDRAGLGALADLPREVARLRQISLRVSACKCHWASGCGAAPRTSPCPQTWRPLP